MTPTDWAALAVSVATIVGAFVASVRWLVKHYLSELRPNSGSSLRDSVDRLEERVDRIYEMLCDRKN
jgi:hypothetical protein